MTTTRTSRRNLDQYFTPEWATRELLKHIEIQPTDTVLEPCAGDGAISKVLLEKTQSVITNDIDRTLDVDFHRDAAKEGFWDAFHGWWQTDADWIISNPPFSLANEIIPLAHKHYIKGMAMMLRLSFLEPTYDRGEWLSANPPDQIIVLPRISFTGDGKTDSVTTAWFIWQPLWDYKSDEHILIIPKGTRENPTFKK